MDVEGTRFGHSCALVILTQFPQLRYCRLLEALHSESNAVRGVTGAPLDLSRVGLADVKPHSTEVEQRKKGRK